MALPLILVALWAVIANILTLTPGQAQYWRNAALLICTGIPIVGLVTWQHGPWIGLFVMAAGIVMLRWPVISLGRRIKRRTLRQ